MEPFSSIVFTSRSTLFVVPDLTLVFWEPSPVLVPLEEQFATLLLKPRVDLLSIVSKLEEIHLSSLPGHILEFFVQKIIFLELDEHELIPPCLS